MGSNDCQICHNRNYNCTCTEADIENVELKDEVNRLQAEISEAERRGEERGFRAGWERACVWYIEIDKRNILREKVQIPIAISDWRASEEYKEGK